MDNLLWLIYTHKDYDDMFEITLKRLVKYCPYVKYAVCSNDVDHIRNKYKDFTFHALYQYDDAVMYGERIRSVLCQIQEKYIIHNHEHDILVEPVDMNVISFLIYTMENEGIDQLRLSVSGIESPIFDKDLSINPIKGPYHLSLITALWKRESLLSIATEFSSHSYRCFECDPIQVFASKMKNCYLSSNKDFKYVNEGHYFSYYFPTAHCTHYGKWHTSTPTAAKFIRNIQDEYGIDLSKRGEN
jgi:hypothetical protein